jgi:HAD superfamily hydrolase (TIGR01457 family)
MNELIDPLKSIKLAIFDLDGVIYRGNQLIANVDFVIKKIRKLHVKVVFNSNNSTATRETYVKRLKEFNIDAELSDVFTSAYITAIEISKRKKNANVFVIGETGLIQELQAEGHQIFTQDQAYDDVDFVIVGLDREFHYSKLAFAQKCLLKGKAHFFATNRDATLPVPSGLLPGAGVMVNALETCTGMGPEITFGKPEPYGLELILKMNHCKPSNAILFGDRLDTDILGGNRANIHTALVLTGVTSLQSLESLKKKKNFDVKFLPEMVFSSLDEIFQS